MLRPATGALAVAASLALAGPAPAAAQSCQVPKAWQTAALQLEYELGKELGLTQQHTQELLRRASTALPDATTAYVGQRVVSTGYVVTALTRFGTTVLGTPPDCRRR